MSWIVLSLDSEVCLWGDQKPDRRKSGQAGNRSEAARSRLVMVTIAPMLASPSRRPDLPARETLRGRPFYARLVQMGGSDTPPSDRLISIDVAGSSPAPGSPVLLPVRAVELAPARAFFFNTAPIGDARIDLTAWGFFFRDQATVSRRSWQTTEPSFIVISSSLAWVTWAGSNF